MTIENSSIHSLPGLMLTRAWAMPARWKFFTEPNNTWIGLLYIATGFLFFLAAGVLAVLIRIQLAIPYNTFLDPVTFNQVFTMHGTVMVLLFGVPIGEAFAMMLLPSMVGSRDMPKNTLEKTSMPPLTGPTHSQLGVCRRFANSARLQNTHRERRAAR